MRTILGSLLILVAFPGAAQESESTPDPLAPCSEHFAFSTERISSGEVRQVIEISTDQGGTWRTMFDALYVQR